MRTYTTLFASFLTLAVALACSGAGSGDVAAEPDAVAVVTDPALEEAEAGSDKAEAGSKDAGTETPSTDEEDATDEAQAKAGAYSSNVYGVCRKYTDCDCNLYGSVTDCVEEFGDAKNMFPPSVWGCVLARDCEGLCVFNAGTCFELYALQYTKGSKKGAKYCEEGTLPIEYYDRDG
ncbi:MAG: hypothetical protein JRI25_14705, partial [Deltaproteobacteria bacterium]|nr:hypothetical protein [Deltaproteobacteria bacterium]